MSERSRMQEPCMCGDPECPNCFPSYYEEYDDEPPTLSEAGVTLGGEKSIADACVEAVADIATPELTESAGTMLNSLDEIQRPKWLKASMKVEEAARQCAMRGCYLKAYWDSCMGLKIVAVKRGQE